MERTWSRKKLTDSRIAQIRKFRVAGFTFQRISDLCGITLRTAQQYSKGIIPRAEGGGHVHTGKSKDKKSYHRNYQRARRAITDKLLAEFYETIGHFDPSESEVQRYITELERRDDYRGISYFRVAISGAMSGRNRK